MQTFEVCKRFQVFTEDCLHLMSDRSATRYKAVDDQHWDGFNFVEKYTGKVDLVVADIPFGLFKEPTINTGRWTS